MIQDDGRWRLSLRADQNPLVETATGLTTVLPSSNSTSTLPTTSKPALPTAPIRGLPSGTAKDTAFLKRNLFVIQLRGLGDFSEPIATPPEPSKLGKPVLFATPPIKFWVQNGVPYSLVTEATSSDVQMSVSSIAAFDGLPSLNVPGNNVGTTIVDHTPDGGLDPIRHMPAPAGVNAVRPSVASVGRARAIIPPSAPVPPTEELQLLDPNVDPLGRPAVKVSQVVGPDGLLRVDYGVQSLILEFGYHGRPKVTFRQGVSAGMAAKVAREQTRQTVSRFIARTGAPEARRKAGETLRNVAGSTADRIQNVAKAAAAPVIQIVKMIPGIQMLTSPPEQSIENERDALVKRGTAQLTSLEGSIPTVR